VQLRFIGLQGTKLQLRFVHIKNQNRCVLLVWIFTLLLGTSSVFPWVEFLTVKKTSFSQGYEMTEAQKKSREEICISPPTSKGIPSCILSFPQRGTSKSFLTEFLHYVPINAPEHNVIWEEGLMPWCDFSFSIEYALLESRKVARQADSTR
jgi:hypothetical protein